MADRGDQNQLDIEPSTQAGKKMYRTMAEISSAIKSARDVMRKDAGLNGDLDRLPQLSWLLLLRAFSERVDGFHSARNPEYEPTLDKDHQWDTWAGNKEFTGDSFLNFVNDDLLPYLRALKGTSNVDPRSIISAIFQEIDNRMLSGVLLRDLVNIVDRIDFQANGPAHAMTFVYESIMKEMRDTAGDSGEFYTPRPVVKFMTEQSFLKLGESVLDPACGTGGFLVEAFDKLTPLAKTSVSLAQLHNNIRGIEKKPFPYLLCIMNLLLHDVDSPRVVRDNALTRMRSDASPRDRVDVILTNPPFGGQEEQSVAAGFPKGYATRETSWLFLYSVVEQLKPDGRCAIVLPNGSLFDTSKSAELIKKKLMKECDLHTIVRLPLGVFAPYTQIPANLLFFEKTGPTKETWFYEIPLAEDRRGYTKTKPMQYEEFADCIEWWGGKDRAGRKENGRAWKIDINKIEASGYNLDWMNPDVGNDFGRRQPVELADELINAERELLELLHETKENLKAVDANTPPRRTLGDILTLAQQKIQVVESQSYRITGIHSSGQGLIRRGIIQGSGTAYKYLTPLRTGQLVMSKLSAWRGGLAVVSDDFDGTFVSPEYPVFDIDQVSASIDYLRHLVSWPELWKKLAPSGSPAGRMRTNPDTLLAINVPIPTLAEQEMLSKKLDQLARIRQIAHERASHLSALHVAALDSAFAGRL
jgi:type I restriction enzyme M protein